MSIVLAQGTEPGLPFVGEMPLFAGADESHFVGVLFGEGIEVTSAETVDLPVPATAEIVIRGPHPLRGDRDGGADERVPRLGERDLADPVRQFAGVAAEGLGSSSTGDPAAIADREQPAGQAYQVAKSRGQRLAAPGFS